MELIMTTDVTKAVHSKEFVEAVRLRMWNFKHWNPKTEYKQAPSYCMTGSTYVVPGAVAQAYVKADLKADRLYILHEGIRAAEGYLVATEIA